MKQNAMKSYCRKKGAMVLMRYGDRQWVQAGTAFYPLDGWPPVEDMEFLTLMEVPADEQPTFPLAHWSEPPAKLIPMMEESMREQEPVQLSMCRLEVDGEMWQPVFTRAGVRFVEAAALKPLEDVRKLMVMTYEQHEGVEAIVCRVGLLTHAVLLCQRGFVNDDVAEEMDDIAGEMRHICEARWEAEANADKQMRMEGC